MAAPTHLNGSKLNWEGNRVNMKKKVKRYSVYSSPLSSIMCFCVYIYICLDIDKYVAI